MPVDVARQKISTAEHNSVYRFVRAIKLGFFILVLLLCVSCTIFVVYSQALERVVHQIDECAKLQVKTQQAAAWGEARHLPALRDRVGLRPTLESTTRDIASAHGRLVTGDLSTSFADHVDVINRPWVPVTYYYGSGHDGHHFHKIRIRSLSDAGYDLAAASNQTVHEVAGTVMSSAQMFVERNAPNMLAHAFNLSSQAYVEDAEHALQDHLLLQLVLGLLGLTLMLMVYLTQSWAFTATVVEQLVALQMFTLLPKSDVNDLMLYAQDQLHYFDGFVGDEFDSDNELDDPEEPSTSRREGTEKKRVGFVEPGSPLSPQSPRSDFHSSPQNSSSSASFAGSDDTELMLESSEAGKSYTEITWKAQLLIVLLLGMQFILSVVAAGLILTIFMNGDMIEQKLEVRALALHTAEQQRELVMYQLREARGFAQFGEHKHYDNYWRKHHSGEHERILRRFAELRIPKEEQLKLAESEAAFEEVVEIEKVSMYLTIRAYNQSISDYPEMRGFQYDIKHERPFNWHNSHFNGLYYTNTENDMSLPQTTLQALCRSILFDARMQYETNVALTPISEFEQLLERRTLKDVQGAEALINLLYALTMVVFVCLAASFTIMLIGQQRIPALRQLQVLCCVVSVSVLVMVLVVLVVHKSGARALWDGDSLCWRCALALFGLMHFFSPFEHRDAGDFRVAVVGLLVSGYRMMFCLVVCADVQHSCWML